MRPAFLDLPTDILVAVADNLCPHCTPEKTKLRVFAEDPEQQTGTPESHWDRITTLSRLSRTCKTLRNITQPILFHCAFANGRCFYSLVQTVARRPDLARAVRELSFTAHDYATNRSPLDVELLNGLLNELFANSKTPGEGFRLLQDESSTSYDPDSWETDLVLSVLLISLVVNVERLFLSSRHYEWPDDFPPTALRRLKELGVNCELGRGSGMGEAKSGSLTALAPIVNSAPELRIYRATDMILYYPPLAHREIVEVDLRMTDLREKDLVDMFKGFTTMKKFTYQAGCTMGGYSQNLNPRALASALLHCRNTLTHLCVLLEHSVERERWTPEDMIVDLRQMTALEHLELDDATVYACGVKCIALTSPQSPLSDLLPLTIRSFTLSLWRQHKHILEDVRKLGRAVPHSLPRLNSVCIAGVSQDTQGAIWEVLQRSSLDQEMLGWD